MGGYICTRARVYPFVVYGNGWSDRAEVWYVVRDKLSGRFTQTKGGYLHVRKCVPLFRISGAAGRIVLEVMWAEGPISYATRVTQVMNGVTVSARAQSRGSLDIFF